MVRLGHRFYIPANAFPFEPSAGDPARGEPSSPLWMTGKTPRDVCLSHGVTLKEGHSTSPVLASTSLFQSLFPCASTILHLYLRSQHHAFIINEVRSILTAKISLYTIRIARNSFSTILRLFHPVCFPGAPPPVSIHCPGFVMWYI